MKTARDCTLISSTCEGKGGMKHWSHDMEVACRRAMCVGAREGTCVAGRRVLGQGVRGSARAYVYVYVQDGSVCQ